MCLYLLSPVDCDFCEVKGLSDFVHHYSLSSQHSTWNILGAQYILVTWMNKYVCCRNTIQIPVAYTAKGYLLPRQASHPQQGAQASASYPPYSGMWEMQPLPSAVACGPRGQAKGSIELCTSSYSLSPRSDMIYFHIHCVGESRSHDLSPPTHTVGSAILLCCKCGSAVSAGRPHEIWPLPLRSQFCRVSLQFGLIFSSNVDHISFVLRKPTWLFTHSINVFGSCLLAQAQAKQWGSKDEWNMGPDLRLVWVRIFSIYLVLLSWQCEKYHLNNFFVLNWG